MKIRVIIPVLILGVFLVAASLIPKINDYKPEGRQKDIMRAVTICGVLHNYFSVYGVIPKLDSSLSRHLMGDNPEHEVFMNLDSLPRNSAGEYLAVDGRPFKYFRSGLTISIYSQDGDFIYKCYMGPVNR